MVNYDKWANVGDSDDSDDDASAVPSSVAAIVPAGAEPSIFTTHFPAWDRRGSGGNSGRGGSGGGGGGETERRASTTPASMEEIAHALRTAASETVPLSARASPFLPLQEEIAGGVRAPHFHTHHRAVSASRACA